MVKVSLGYGSFVPVTPNLRLSLRNGSQKVFEEVHFLHLSFEVHYTNLKLLVEISFESVQRLRLGSDKKIEL